ncbi:hypothetical protein ACEPPN_008098 [Leptodophora sp. 'Broadleaf-Isolate-01']
MATTTTAPRLPLSEVNANSIVSAPATSASQKPGLSKKRKADDDEPEYHIDDDICQNITISCNAVRAKVRRFLESGEMKVGEFQRAIGASSTIYGKFMNQNGPYKGSGSSVYRNAFAFFKLRELNGVKITKKKKVEGTTAEKGGKAGTKSDTNFEDITLEGEEENEVPVYDSCDEIRRKIRQYISKTGMTQAAFAREIAKSFHPEKKVSGLAAFLGKKGPAAGNTSSVFYGSYVFFEKMRIKNKNPKTQHRLGMEDAWDGMDFHAIHDGSGPGMNVKTILDKVSYVVGVNQSVYQDEFGKPQVVW